LQGYGGESGDLASQASADGTILDTLALLDRRRDEAAEPGQVTGISTVAFSFMVQDPKGIIEWTSDRSFAPRRWICAYRPSDSD
jgi:hypothetical protein